jgi:hypothetical protein
MLTWARRQRHRVVKLGKSVRPTRAARYDLTHERNDCTSCQCKDLRVQTSVYKRFDSQQGLDPMKLILLRRNGMDT